MGYLLTGDMGSGKTCNALALLDTDDRFKEKIKYCLHINISPDFDFNSPFIQITKKELETWDNGDFRGSVIVVDEAHHYFPERGPTFHIKHQEDPDYRWLFLLSESRSRDVEFVFITQSPRKLWSWLYEGVINEHYHYQRTYKNDRTREYYFRPVNKNPASTISGSSEASLAFTEKAFPKRYFDAYKSAEAHSTNLGKKPRKLVLIQRMTVFAVLCVLVSFYYIGGLHHKLFPSEAKISDSLKQELEELKQKVGGHYYPSLGGFSHVTFLKPNTYYPPGYIGSNYRIGEPSFVFVYKKDDEIQEVVLLLKDMLSIGYSCSQGGSGMLCSNIQTNDPKDRFYAPGFRQVVYQQQKKRSGGG
jgi:hypothetical protein